MESGSTPMERKILPLLTDISLSNSQWCSEEGILPIVRDQINHRSGTCGTDMVWGFHPSRGVAVSEVFSTKKEEIV